MKKSIISVAMAIAAMLSLPSIAQETGADTPPDFDAKMATVQFMNYMNYVVYTLSSYQNVFVIEDEYRNLSTGNLNLNRIPDDKVLDAIEKMLDTIQDMRADEKQRERFLEVMEKEAQHARQDIFINAMKSAVAMTAESGALSIQVVKSAIAGDANDVAKIAELSKAIGAEAASTYSKYVDVQRNLERQSSDNKFNYDLQKDAKLHEQNKYQLRLQYSLTKDYGINDAYRLSDENAEALVAVIKSEDHVGAFRRMKGMLADQPAYNHFPMFWRYYAAFALEAKDAQTALNAYNHFREINRHSLFRHDRMAADAAMAGVSAMMALGNPDKEAVRESLGTIRAYNYNCSDVDMAFFCASTYYAILGDCKNALEILDRLVAVLEDRARNALRKYRDPFDPGKPDAPWAEPPAVTDLFRCQMLRKAVMESEKDGSFRSDLEQILERSTTASIEKLFFMGDVRVKDLWKKARLDVDAIQLKYEKHDIAQNSLVALIPISWFALGDFPIKVDLFSGNNKVGTLEESFKKRMLAFDRPASDLTYAKIEWKCPTTTLKGVDDYVLRLPHKSWPVSIHFRPPLSVDVRNAKFMDSVSHFIPQRAEFMGETFQMYGENENANAELFHVQLKDVVIPEELLKTALEKKGHQAMLVNSQLYVEVSRTGEVIWRSPAIEVKSGDEKEQFEFQQDRPDTSFALMWKPGDRIVVSVKVAEKEAFVKASTTGAGGAAGALAGAGIGAAGAAAFTGGLGAPAGALIGAAIGFFGGAGIGAVIPVEGARTVISFILPSDEFGLDGELGKKIVFSTGDIGKASVSLDGRQRRDALAQNGLELQKKYVVRLRSVCLSSKAPKFKEGAEYYMLVTLYGEEKPLRIDLPHIPKDAIVPLEDILVLKNCGGESAVEIRRKGVGRDVQMFKAMQGATNGSSWIFIGKSSDDNGSFVEFDTFPAGD